MVVCESMACGTPVICTRRGGIPEVVGNAGIIVDEPDPHQLANAILEFIQDKRRMERASLLSIQRAGKFSWTKIANRWANLVSTLIEECSLEPFRLENTE